MPCVDDSVPLQNVPGKPLHNLSHYYIINKSIFFDLNKTKQGITILKIKNLIMIIVILILSATSVQAQDTLKVLFLGNSHTYFNDMPQLFANLSESGGHQVIIDSNTPGGHTLEQHSNNATSLNKISLGIWDYVVLQENSQYPVINYLRYNSMYPAARELDSLITFFNGTTTIFMNWGWRYGGQCEVDGHQSPLFEDYFHMQDSMTSACTEIAIELSAVLALAGEAWRTAVTWDPALVLWDPDNYHPALNGSYLTACVFYATFYNESPVGIEYSGGLSDDEALFLQQAAWETLTDIDDKNVQLPSSFELYQNYPNPFNAQTTLSFSLPKQQSAILKIYDLLGREVETLVKEEKQAGHHSFFFDASGLSSGVYFYGLRVGDMVKTKRMVLLR